MQMERAFRILVLLLSFGSISTLATLLVVIHLSAAIPLLFLIIAIGDAEIVRRYGKAAGVGGALAYFAFMLFSVYAGYASSIILSIIFFLLPFLWSMELRGESLEKTLKSLGIGKDRLLQNIVFGILATLFLLYPLIIVEGIIITRLQLEKVGMVAKIISGLPIYLLIFSFTFTPFAEEIFFRGFLSDRIGIVLSSLLFSLAHFSYSSPSEFIGTFTAGMVFAILCRKRKSLVPSIAAHALFNLVEVMIVYFAKPVIV
jgi:membrane protease YdiL (CAAX protease family)